MACIQKYLVSQGHLVPLRLHLDQEAASTHPNIISDGPTRLSRSRAHVENTGIFANEAQLDAIPITWIKATGRGNISASTWYGGGRHRGGTDSEAHAL
jgi:hypothetical protein